MSKAQKNQTARELARRFSKVIEINNGDILVIQQEPETGYEFFKQIRLALSARNLDDTVVILTEDMDSIRTISEEEMANYGWQRIPEKETS